MRQRFRILLVAALTGCGGDSDPDAVCQEAAEHVEACFGEAVDPPALGCTAEQAELAVEVADTPCGELIGGKADGGLWCAPPLAWLGLCAEAPALGEHARLEGLEAACPASRTDALCTALREAEAAEAQDAGAAYARARDAVRHRMRTAPDEGASDDAVQYYLRERQVALLVWNVVTEGGELDLNPAEYGPEAREALSEYYPAYAPEQFHMALSGVVPLGPDACEEPQALLLFPGVLRLTLRDEFHEQIAALEEAVPCLRIARVDTGSFVSPYVNAEQGMRALAELEAKHGSQLPVHLLGYSQGARNALQTLVDDPEIAERTRSVVNISSAARGSEVGDLMHRIAMTGDTLCDQAPGWLRPTCEWAAERSPRPADLILAVLARALSVTSDELDAFIEAEDAVAKVASIREMFIRHLDGIESLTTWGSAAFWREEADGLPRAAVYMTFRAAITRPELNLPASNRIFFQLLRRASADVPHNDMQVRLPLQSLGGPVAASEVLSPVAEGNHWQWVLADGAVPQQLMAPHMTQRMPHRELLLSYFQALLDAGVI